MGKKNRIVEQPLLFDFADEVAPASANDAGDVGDVTVAEADAPITESEPHVAESERQPKVETEDQPVAVADEQPKRKKFRGRPMKRKREKEVLPQGMPSYLSVLNPAKAEQLAKEIFRLVVLEKRFLDPKLTARDLAQRLHTNTRYFSITMNRRFHCNFSTFVNRLRVEEAMTRMCDSRYDEVSLQDIASFVGFASRQSFIAAFQKINGTTPSAYRASLHASASR